MDRRPYSGRVTSLTVAVLAVLMLPAIATAQASHPANRVTIGILTTAMSAWHTETQGARTASSASMSLHNTPVR